MRRRVVPFFICKGLEYGRCGQLIGHPQPPPLVVIATTPAVVRPAAADVACRRCSGARRRLLAGFHDGYSRRAPTGLLRTPRMARAKSPWKARSARLPERAWGGALRRPPPLTTCVVEYIVCRYI